MRGWPIGRGQRPIPKALAEAESAVPLHAQVAGESAQAFLTRSRLPSKLADARAAVKKSQVRTQLLAAMDAALKEGAASKVYQARDDLVDQYADLARDRELIGRMTSANELIRKAVKVDTTKRAAARNPRPEPLGPPTSIVLRSRPEPASPAAAPESMVYALVEGFGYGIDAVAGAPLWQVPLGLSSPFVPQAVPGEAAAIAFDARSNELLRLDARTGALSWRLELGERVTDPPLVLGNQLVQVVPSGKLMMISLATGELQATMNLGRPLARTPVSDESGRHLYVLGRQDILLILNRDPLGCAAVEYLGHADGSIPCSPCLLGRFLVVPQNDTLADSRWQILVLDEEGSKVKPAQEVKVAGWTWQTPAVSGQFVWATGDRAGFEAFAVGEYGAKQPFRSVARQTPDAASSGPAFAITRSEREMWAASGHSGQVHARPRARHDPSDSRCPAPGRPWRRSRARATRSWRPSSTARWTAPRSGGSIPSRASVTWRTVVGSAWHTSLSRVGRLGGPVHAGTGRTRGDDRSRAGRTRGVRRAAVARTGCVRLAARPALAARARRQAALRLIPRPYSKAMWVQDGPRPGGWRELTLPAAVAADPLVWQDGVLIPGADARVYLIDPLTGRSRAEPFVPKFDRDHQGTWLAPALLDPDTIILADDVGRVRRIGLKTTPVPRLASEAEKALDSRIVADPATTGAAVLVATADGRVRSLPARDLSPIGAWRSMPRSPDNPVGLADGGLAMDRAGGIVAFGRMGRRAGRSSWGPRSPGHPGRRAVDRDPHQRRGPAPAGALRRRPARPPRAGRPAGRRAHRHRPRRHDPRCARDGQAPVARIAGALERLTIGSRTGSGLVGWIQITQSNYLAPGSCEWVVIFREIC